ncbi:MAG: diaminopimelate decarboxylase [Actinomycetota bacterium]|nr:diaminopimelate decarboxylase [Actinomycetota bacterium]
MGDFTYKNGKLYCEELRVQNIAEKVGTPFYLYSWNSLIQNYKAIDEAFGDLDHLVCFSVKACSNVAILKILAGEGAGADVVSGGELYRAQRAEIDPQKIVFSGPGKTSEEIEQAIMQDILMLNVESSEELMLVNEIAQQKGVKARIALRVNPEVEAETHPYMTTGVKGSKFGIPISQAMAEYEVAQKLPGVEPIGIHQHIGSQIVKTAPFEESVEKLTNLAKSLAALEIEIKYLNIGGGFGIPYDDSEVASPEDYGRALTPILKESGAFIVIEAGRAIAGNAGILVTSVLYNKQSDERNIMVVDAGMSDILRPTLYHAEHKIAPVLNQEDAPSVKADIVGPLCEAGDFIAIDRAVPRLKKDDLLAVFDAGAYGFSMSSNYNSRLRPPEVLVSGRKAYLIRRRDTFEDLVRNEAIPKDL